MTSSVASLQPSATGSGVPKPTSQPGTQSGGSQQGSGDGSGVGRGAGQQGTARGSARPTSFILTTRPVTAKVKVGDKGAPFNAYTNAFKIQKRPNWNLVQHRVDFKPDEDETKMRK